MFPLPGFEKFTRARLGRDLAAMGIRAGDVLLVHSSLRSIGWVDGGPAAVIAAFKDILGPTGTLVMPVFTFNVSGWGVGAFDHAATPSRVGLITEIFRRSPGVLRSKHPTHSVAACGPLAAEFVDGPLEYSPLGKGSPLDRVRLAGGKILMVGVGQDRNSTLHLAECLAPAPYLSISFTPGREFDIGLSTRPGGGDPLLTPLPEMPGSSEGFTAIEEPLRARGVLVDTMLGKAKCQLHDAAQLVEAAVDEIRMNPEIFLHGTFPSEISRRRLAHVRSLGATISRP